MFTGIVAAVGTVRAMKPARSGWRVVATSRTVRRGSSSRTVPIPVSTAHARARQ